MKTCVHAQKVKLTLYACLALALAGCATDRPDVGTRVVYQTVEKEVPRPCPVTKPARPKPLARPLPTDPARLVDLLTAKLLEWEGPGGYWEKADADLSICVKP